MKKVFTATAIALCIGSAMAQAPQPSQQPIQGQKVQKIAEHKQKIIERLQARVQKLQSAISCVQAAADRKSLKACREQLRPQSGGNQQQHQGQ